MKKTIPIVLMILSFLVISCEKETSDLFNPEVSIDVISNNDNRDPEDCTDIEDYFETQLQWFAYFAAETAAKHKSARTELAAHLANTPSNVILAEDLVGPTATLTVFSAKFNETILPHMCMCWPGSGNYYPPPPPVPGSFPKGTSYQDIADIFYSNMLEENCVEFYFPVGVDFSRGFDVTSSSHPLTAASCNEGFVWQTVLGGMVSSPITLDQTYVNSHDNIFIARPIRDPLIGYCHYNEYSGVVFTDFMD